MTYPDGMDLETQGEMADQLAAAQSATQRVRVVAMETLRLCREAGVPESSAHLHPNAVLRALDGDTTEES